MAGDAGDKTGRHEHGTKHERNRNQRRAHLVHAFDGGFTWRQAGCDIALDVLHHDDGVVHHDTDRQHEPEQCQMAMKKNVPMSEIGIATRGMIAARQVCRKRTTTNTTRRMASPIVFSTSSTDCRMN